MKVAIDLTDRSDLEVGERYAKEALMASLAMAKLTQLRRAWRINRQMVFNEPVVYDWPSIDTPTLVIGGAEDGPDFPELAENAATTLPNAELVLFDDVGHNSHFEAPELLFPALIRFLMDGEGGVLAA